jgi:hypothetical protein
MAAGGTGSALNGGSIKQIATGIALGGAIGAASGGVFWAGGSIGGAMGSAAAGQAVASGAMLAGGAAYSYHQGGWTGVANFAGGIAGGIAGGAMASYVQNNYNNWFQQQPQSGPSPSKGYLENPDVSNQYAELDMKKWAQMTDSVEYSSTKYNDRLNSITKFAWSQVQGYALGVKPPSPVTGWSILGIVVKDMVFPQELADPHLATDGTWRYPSGEQVPGKGRLW